MTVLFQFFSVMKVTFGIPQRKNHVLWLVKLGSPTAEATWTDMKMNINFFTSDSNSTPAYIEIKSIQNI